MFIQANFVQSKDIILVGDYVFFDNRIIHKDNLKNEFNEFSSDKASENKLNSFLKKYTEEENYEELVSHENKFVRLLVACNAPSEQILIQLAKDEATEVKEVVSKFNIKETLDILKNDESWIVRKNVAEHYNEEILEFLQNDKSHKVRIAVAKHLHLTTLENLKNDSSEFVREQVAKQPVMNFLLELKNDPSGFVSSTAKEMLEKIAKEN